MYVQVEDSTFIRDTQTGALINQDYSGRDEYLAKVNMINKQKSDINTINTEIDSIKSEISDIKNLLTTLINKL